MSIEVPARLVLGSGDRPTVELGGLGVVFTILGEATSGALSMEPIFPAGFEHFFAALGPINASPGDPADRQRQREELGRRYRLGFDPTWVEDLKARYAATGSGS